MYQNVFCFLYDENGELCGTIINSNYYIKNIFGNILGLVDQSGSYVADYVYDAWGNILSATASIDNSLRYKGYYYDSETDMYYCHTRYYVPKWLRWLNSDNVEYLDTDDFAGINLFVYCGNNPVIAADPDGTFNWKSFGRGLAVIGGVVGGISASVSGENVLSGILDGASDGLMKGAIIGGAAGALSAGANILFGGVKIIGSAQKTGYALHRFASNVQAGKFAMQVGRYSTIALDKTLNKAGMIGRKMPDVVAVARCGSNKMIEIVSSTQTVASQEAKIVGMLQANPGTIGKVVGWAFQHWFLF